MSHQENAQKSRSFMVFLVRNHMELHGIEVKKIRENKLENTENVGYNPTPRPESYTLSFTRNPQYIKGFSRIGVGNVGEKHKTFL